jgi:hypothetical protein
LKKQIKKEEEKEKIARGKRLVIATKIWKEITSSALRSKLYQGVLEFIRQSFFFNFLIFLN